MVLRNVHDLRQEVGTGDDRIPIRALGFILDGGMVISQHLVTLRSMQPLTD